MLKQISRRKFCYFLLFCFININVMDVMAEKNNKEESEDAYNFSSFVGKITGNRVRMRLHPNLDSPIIKELNEGELLVVVGKSDDYFAILPPQNVNAYVYRTYVLDGVIEGDHVNVRMEPNMIFI